MYQYFVKVVPTVYEPIDSEVLNTNQFSVTEHYKALQGEGAHGLPGK
jgi:endoplasmic reticulum-Golgi intermediate compartment protein 3